VKEKIKNYKPPAAARKTTCAKTKKPSFNQSQKLTPCHISITKTYNPKQK